MGITFVTAKLINPRQPSKTSVNRFLVDSGATFSVVPREDLLKIGIKSHRKQDFILADGTKIVREIGDAIFEFEGLKGAAPVVFGEKGDSRLLGVFTLEALGLVFDPFQRKLKPMRLMMV